ncbi:4-phosphoerythronate dehydrogenase [bacterium]|nr:4-phosphoerythronate dehydrogenase [bacterium]
MKIVADQNMLMVDHFFAELGSITYLPGRTITAADVADADLLLVRSITEVNQSLLDGSSVAFVGSATIGTDHVDQAYLKAQGIGFAHAPGCNADAVVQYDLSVLSRLQPDWLQSTVGIVGCGNVGSRLYRSLTNLGVRCRVYDPFLAADSTVNQIDFKTVLDAQVICLHTPLTQSGSHPTQHLFNAEVLSQLDESTLLINAGRGAVIDNLALLARLRSGSSLRVALDVWEYEPTINLELLDRVALATPHIAGHSVEGKLRGTQMLATAYHAWANHEQSSENREPAITVASSAKTVAAETLSELILASYDVSQDDARFRAALHSSLQSSVAIGETFDLLRKQYPERHEFGYYRAEAPSEIRAQALQLGFC